MPVALSRSLHEQRAEIKRNPFLAIPIAGTIAWCIVGVGGAFLPVGLAAWVLFFATGSIFGLGLLVSRILGDDLKSGAHLPYPLDRAALPGDDLRAGQAPARVTAIHAASPAIRDSHATAQQHPA